MLALLSIIVQDSHLVIFPENHMPETTHRVINERKSSNIVFIVTFNVHVVVRQNHGSAEAGKNFRPELEFEGKKRKLREFSPRTG